MAAIRMTGPLNPSTNPRIESNWPRLRPSIMSDQFDSDNRCQHRNTPTAPTHHAAPSRVSLGDSSSSSSSSSPSSSSCSLEPSVSSSLASPIAASPIPASAATNPTASPASGQAECSIQMVKAIKPRLSRKLTTASVVTVFSFGVPSVATPAIPKPNHGNASAANTHAEPVNHIPNAINANSGRITHKPRNIVDQSTGG